MRDYGKVFCALWTSEDFRGLSEDGRALVLYLLTSPHGTMIGCFSLPDGYICEDLQWSSERVRQGFEELLAKRFANRCEITRWVWIGKYLEWNQPDNPNQWKAARKLADKIPERCTWRTQFQHAFSIAAGDVQIGQPNGSATVSKSGSGSGAGTVVRSAVAPDAISGGVSGAAPSRNPSDPKGRGSRLPEDFLLTTARARLATEEGLDAPRTFAKFRDYWVSVAGAKGVKLDWDATWRNWVRSEADRGGGKKTSGGDNGLPTLNFG